MPTPAPTPGLQKLWKFRIYLAFSFSTVYIFGVKASPPFNMVPPTTGPLMTSLLLLLIAGCCCGYVVDSRTDSADNQLVTTQQQASAGRRFGWVINWLNERGPLGQLLANIIVAVFVLPPLGPFVCALLENCDSLKNRARTFLRSVGDVVDPGSLRGSRSISDEVSEALKQLDAAYDKYSS